MRTKQETQLLQTDHSLLVCIHNTPKFHYTASKSDCYLTSNAIRSKFNMFKLFVVITTTLVIIAKNTWNVLLTNKVNTHY